MYFTTYSPLPIVIVYSIYHSQHHLYLWGYSVIKAMCQRWPAIRSQFAM